MALHPLVPFTYSLNALRETISGAPMNGKILAQSLAVQLVIALCAVIICAIIENLRGKKRTAPTAIAA